MSITISAAIGFSVSSITRTVVQSLNKFAHCCVTENMPLWSHNTESQNGSTGESIGGGGGGGGRGEVCVLLVILKLKYDSMIYE